MLLIYADRESTRLQYIVEELFVRRLGISAGITSSETEVGAHDGPCISYSDRALPGTLHIRPAGLLHETGIPSVFPEVKQAKWWRYYFFETGDADLPFDVLSAAFWLLSRCEEYGNVKTDSHGRFDHHVSLAARSGFLEIPLVETWVQQLAYHLGQKFPQVGINEGSFIFHSTIDIDFAYRYLGIGLKRQLQKLGWSVLSLRLHDAVTQVKCMLGFERDPYDTYELIRHVCEENRVKLGYFVLMRSVTDYIRNINISDPLLKRTLTRLAGKADLGLHPSYYSSREPQLTGTEKKILDQMTGKVSVKTRQHYLRFTLPETYRTLISEGFTDEYSMAYSGACGFRASTCKPFRFFDLGTNAATNLLIHPAALMDTTLRFAMKLTPEQAMKKIEQLMNEVQKAGGTCISIWHNSSLGSEDGWEGWREVFEKMHTLADSLQNQTID